ncbi:hypothetical protein MW7_007175 [Imbroritus primus]|uniref:Uncharacterized protein n=1 Tax=Imbroritus primus TaxID=3058603 RepID=A0ACD3SQV7_9BURK|nr:hypothetical protein MW7_007175 [Burkholderiaceae bacterium PBA]
MTDQTNKDLLALFRLAPEPVAHPSSSWTDEYAEWHRDARAALSASAPAAGSVPSDITVDHIDRFEASLSDLGPGTRGAAALVCSLAKVAILAQYGAQQEISNLKLQVEKGRQLVREEMQRTMEAQQEAISLRDRAQQDKEDAERYRWRRDNPEKVLDCYKGKWRVTDCFGFATEWCDTQDAAIDAARAADKGE